MSISFVFHFGDGGARAGGGGKWQVGMGGGVQMTKEKGSVQKREGRDIL